MSQSDTKGDFIDYPEKTRLNFTVRRGDRIVLDKLIERGVFASYSDALKKLIRFYRITFEGLPAPER
jgi:hypothetical protein